MRILLVLMSAFWVASCASVPRVTANRPWIRTLSGGTQITPRMALRIQCNGVSDTSMGTRSLMESSIGQTFHRLLLRRGYVVVDSATTEMVLRFRTERLSESSTTTIATSISDWEFGESIISLASVVALRSESRVRFAYSHEISIEATSDGNVIWKAESNWRSNSSEIREGLTGALQLLLCDLPGDSTVIPEIQKVKSTHVENYFSEYCRDTWFSCPATPFRIRFKPPIDRTSVPAYKASYLKNPEALPIFVDLAQTAETALPLGGFKNSVPVSPDLWSRVMLGGRYITDAGEDTICALIDLRGSAKGYEPHKCWIATHEEYAEFESKMAAWKTRVKDYYDMYEN